MPIIMIIIIITSIGTNRNLRSDDVVKNLEVLTRNVEDLTALKGSPPNCVHDVSLKNVFPRCQFVSQIWPPQNPDPVV